MGRTPHSKHEAVANVIEAALPSGFTLIKDEACGGKQRIPLFNSDTKSRKTEYCNVDLLVLKDDKIKMIIEIEESNVKPTQVCGKFLTSALAKYYIHNSQDKPIEMGEMVNFIQIVDASKLSKNKTMKPEQWKELANSINKVLPLRDSRITAYWILSSDKLSELETLIKENK